MEQLIQDFRYGLRTFIRQPGFALTAVLALALGIGANSAVFSVVYAVLLKPLPYPDPAALVYIHDTYPAVTFASVSAAKYVALRERNRTLESLGAQTPGSVTLTGRGEPEQVPATRITADLLRAFRIEPALGRWFSEDEDMPNASPVIVLSHSLWQRRFGGDPKVIGQSITANGVATTVVGVMPPDFYSSAQAWVPLGFGNAPAPGGNFLRLTGRMKPGVSVDQVQQDLSNVSAAFNRENGLQRDVKVWPLHEIIVTDNKRTLLVLQGAVVFVLLIACANVANLLLARSVGRERELAIRAAIGAGRGRLVRQLLTESLLLSILGGAVGVILASWLLRLFVAMAPAGFPRVSSIAIDTGILTFTLVVAMATGLIFGVAPARRGFRTDPNDSLRDTGARGATSGNRGASRLLVVAEIAVALMLVIGAGLMVKSLLKLQSERTGFRADGLLTFELNLPAARYQPPAMAAFYQRALGEIRAIPGVQSAGAINYLPLANFGFNGNFAIEGQPPFPRDAAPVVEYRAVTPGYFGTMGIPVVRGQDFTDQDNAAGRPVVIINQTMAERYWPNGNPIGSRVQLTYDSSAVWREVVGVVGDVRSWRVNTRPVPESYVPHTQAPTAGMGLVVRLDGMNPAQVLPALRQRIAAIDSALPLVRVRPMADIIAASTGETRLSSVLTSVFALVAALLASLGIYSLIAYSVAQRSREIGIRVALGADRSSVVRMVVGEGLTLAAIGLVVGVAGAFLLTRTLRTLLYEVSPTDPSVLAMTCAGLLGVAALASVVPAIRALRVDPAIALRAE